MATHHPIRKTVAPPAPIIPDKLYFRIGDVARLCEVPAYVLRFWETEFPNLKPNKGGTGQRLYRRKDVETALRIKHLLYDLGYTIPGARQVFKNDGKPDAKHGAEVSAIPATSSHEIVEPIGQSVALHESADQSKGSQPIPSEGFRRNSTAITAPALLALRDELHALYTQLSAPLATGATQAPAPLRPRLVAESRPKPRLEPKPLAPKLGPVLFDQQDLFSAE